MFTAKSIAAEHKDLIQDVAYDFHGKRMATCSCDQHVKIWDLIDDEWKCTASWKAHTGSVWHVSWAHPEFGQVIATCSFDRTTAVWEEIPENQQHRWVKRGNLVDSRTSVTDVKFGPKHLGLILATCSVDGVVRIYEATDVMNLSIWNLQHEIQTRVVCSCLSWSTSKTLAPAIAVGSDEATQTAERVQIYEYNEHNRKWFKVEVISNVLEPVCDVAFSPNLGRSYHMLAVASKDLHIFSLKPLMRHDQSVADGSPPGVSRFEIRSIGQFSNHQSQVWRVSWNITGTILASSGDDGRVRLWKGNYVDNWQCIAELKGDSPDIQQQQAFSSSMTTAAAADKTSSRFISSAAATLPAPSWH